MFLIHLLLELNFQVKGKVTFKNLHEYNAQQLTSGYHNKDFPYHISPLS